MKATTSDMPSKSGPFYDSRSTLTLLQWPPFTRRINTRSAIIKSIDKHTLRSTPTIDASSVNPKFLRAVKLPPGSGARSSGIRLRYPAYGPGDRGVSSGCLCTSPVPVMRRTGTGDVPGHPEQLDQRFSEINTNKSMHIYVEFGMLTLRLLAQVRIGKFSCITRQTCTIHIRVLF
jgi:hypothetical protein